MKLRNAFFYPVRRRKVTEMPEFSHFEHVRRHTRELSNLMHNTVFAEYIENPSQLSKVQTAVLPFSLAAYQ